MEKEFINGIYLSYQNAKDLYEDAMILEKYHKSSRAYCLFHLSLEECGRFYMIYNCFIKYVTGEIKAKDFNYKTLRKRGYEDHILKLEENFEGLFTTTYTILALSSQINDPKQFEEEFEKEIEELLKSYNELNKIIDRLNELKNKSLYVIYENNKFLIPDDLIMTSDYLRVKKLSSLSLKAVGRVVDFFEAKGGFSKLRDNLKKGL